VKPIARTTAPIVLARVLGCLTESISGRAYGAGGAFRVLVIHPIFLVCLILAAGVLLLTLIRKSR
jgi:TctA family transporter